VAEALSVLASPVSAERKALEQLEAREALLARAKVFSFSFLSHSITFHSLLLTQPIAPRHFQTLKDQEAATVVDAVVKAVKTRSV
jgi:hypothetical protein